MATNRHINISERLEFIKDKKNKFLKKKGYFWVLVFLILFLIVAIVLDNKYIFPSVIRWIILGVMITGILTVISKIWLLPAKHNTSQLAMGELEKNANDNQQLLRTAHQIEDEKGSQINPLENEVVNEASEQINKVKPLVDSWEKYKLPRKLLRVVGLLFLITTLFSNSIQTGLIRTILPFSDRHYTRIATINPKEFFPESDVEIEVMVKGKRLSNATLFIKETGGDWKQSAVQANHHRYFKHNIESPKNDFEYYITMGDGKSDVQSVIMIAPPKLNAIENTVTPPKYMQKEVINQKSGHIKAYSGSQINLKVKVSRNLTKAYIKLPNRNEKAMIIKGKTLEYKFPMLDTLSGEYAIYGLDDRDTELPKQKYKIQILEDKLPSIKILDPSKDIEVTSVTELPIIVHAQDDISIGEIGIVVKVDGVEKELARFNMKDSTSVDNRKEAIISFEDFNVTQNSNVKVFAWVKDNNPNQTKRGVSVLRGIDIRPFRRFYALPKPKTGELEKPKPSAEALMKLEEMIQVQRNVLSKTFKYIEEGGSFKNRKALSETEEKLSKESTKIYGKIKGKHPLANNLLLASKELKQAALKLTSNKEKEAFEQEDQALTHLVKLRDNLLTILNKAKPNNSMCKKSSDALTELALDVDKLIAQEKRVKDSFEKYVKKPDSTKHYFDASILQRKTINDTKELKSILEIHPDGTPLNIDRIDTIIDVMKKANAQMEFLGNSEKLINQAIEQLEDLALHLRGLDEATPAETLKKAKQVAKKAARELEKQAKDKKTIGKKDSADKKKESKNNKDKESKKEGKKKQEGKKPNDKSGKNSGKNSGKKQGDKSGTNPGNKEGNQLSTQQMARQVEMIKDWLDTMANKKTEDSAEDKFKKEGAKKLLKELPLDQLAKDLRKAGENPTAIELERLAKRMNDVSKALEREELKFTMSKLNQLVSAKKLALDIKNSSKSKVSKQMELIEMLDRINANSLNAQKENLKGQSGSQLNSNLGDIVKNINALIKTLLENKITNGEDVEVPAKYKKMVEDYFKILSDDIDDDSKD